MLNAPPPPDVYTARDIAAAAGVSEARVQTLMARGQIRSLAGMGGAADGADGFRGDLADFVCESEAARAVRALVTGNQLALPADALGLGRELFSEGRRGGRPTAVPLIVSTSLHAVAVATILLVASLGFAAADERTEPLKDPEPLRLVFLAVPGPGGGGGGGGFKMKAPPPKAERQGIKKISSPLPARKVPPPMEPPKRPEPPPPPLEARVLPPVMAPIAEKPADKRDVEGVLAKAPEVAPSQGPGVGGSVGSGKGTGIGQGDGPGVGDGSGGGTGGGPYRPGSGVEPPRLLREVRADYSDEARRANVTGEVVLEIVVRSNGTVGDVKVLRGLPMGLNDRAIDAVKQWRFAPARMKGVPVDVVVEVAVEFKLR